MRSHISQLDLNILWLKLNFAFGSIDLEGFDYHWLARATGTACVDDAHHFNQIVVTNEVAVDSLLQLA